MCLHAISIVSLLTTDYLWKVVTRVTWSILKFYTPLYFSGMAKDRVVKFCARVGPRSACLLMTNCPRMGVVKVMWRLHFLVNKCLYLENGAIRRYAYNGRLIGNRIWPIKWQQRQWPWMTLKVIHRLQAFSNAISRTFVQHFTRFQLTVCSHGSSGLAELLVI